MFFNELLISIVTSRARAPEVKIVLFATLTNTTVLSIFPQLSTDRKAGFVSFILVPKMAEKRTWKREEVNFFWRVRSCFHWSTSGCSRVDGSTYEI